MRHVSPAAAGSRVGVDRRASPRRARHHGMDRIRLGRAGAVHAVLGAAQLCFSRATAPARRFRRRCRSCLSSLVIVLSQLKFIDPLDGDQLLRRPDRRFRHHRFLLSIFPDLRIMAVVGAADRRSGAGADLADRSVPRAAADRAARRGGLLALPSPAWSLAVPEEPWEQFQGVNHVSTFVRSGVTTAYELDHQGLDRFRYRRRRTSFAPRRASRAACPASRRTSSWCSTSRASTPARFPASSCRRATARISVRSTARRASLLVEGSGGPSWYTEYNVLTGLSARSYGRLSYYVTRIAAGRVERGLPQALRRCGYKTFTLYPAYGAFLSARNSRTPPASSASSIPPR